MEHLGSNLSTGRDNPLAPEYIIVQNNGMGQWAAQHIATNTGILANFCFELPTSFAWKIIRSFIEAPQRADLEKDELVWQIFAQLYAHPEEYPEVSEYLGSNEGCECGENSAKLYHLSAQLADIFDQYQVFRQDWILSWEKQDGWGSETFPTLGPGKEHWQVKLWQSISDKASEDSGTKDHRAALINRFFEKTQSGEFDSNHLANILPQRISIFGTDTLAPVYLKFFSVLSQFTEVTIYSFNPCMEYWGDISSEKQMANRRLSGEDAELVEYSESGNNLLSSMGKIGREYHELLMDFEIQEYDCFDKEQLGSSLLHSLQNDILTLQNSSGVCFLDDSILVNDCHTPLRELEVLHDQLLEMFANDSQLKPSDILVMTPDINKYAPFIEAVFERRVVDSEQQSQLPHIPWSISDRTTVAESPVIQAVLQLISISKSRITASEVLELLKVPAVAARFGLDETGIKNIEAWIEQSGIRWGLDNHFRKRFGLPDTELNSWQMGLERMLLGYAVGDKDEVCFDRFGYSEIEGSNAEILGILAQFIFKISNTIQIFSAKHSIRDWQLLLNQLLETFFASNVTGEDEIESTLQQVRDCVDELVTVCDKNPFYEQGIIDIDLISEYFNQELTNRVDSGYFMAGATVFCTLQPMRTVPFKVVCLLGMNDGDFPRQQKRSSLDLIGQYKPRLGDRNRRDDDRYLFLQSLLSAREKLYISYNGRSVIDNSLKMPSALVCELFDYLERFYSIDTKQIITVHPLQPFDRKYYSEDSDLFSYAQQWLNASKSIGQTSEEIQFIDYELPEPEEQFRKITIDELIRFYKNPSAYLLKNRLGINLDLPESELQDDEPFTLDFLEEYSLGKTIMDGLLRGKDSQDLYLQSKLSGKLPHGEIGQSHFNSKAESISNLVDEITPFIANGVDRQTGKITLKIDGAPEIELSAVIDGVTEDGLVLFRPAKLRPIDRIELNIKHLFLQVFSNFEDSAYFFATDENLELNPVRDPVAELEKMLSFYWQGLSNSLPFFPKASAIYSKGLAEGKDEIKAQERAIDSWRGSTLFQGEAQDSYNWVIYKGSFPQDDAFAETALSVLSPRLFGLDEEAGLGLETVNGGESETA